jgi:hypothetical protein
LKLFLDVLECISQELIFICDLGVIFFHSFGDHLIVFMFSIDHDKSRSIGLKLLHHLKGILEASFVLASSYLVLKAFDGLVLLPTCVDVLIFSGFNGSIFFTPLILLPCESFHTILEGFF